MQRQTTQKENVLQYLKANRTGITPIEALKLFGCFRLSGIIYTLKQQGYNIVAKIATVGNKHFANYKLLKPYKKTK